MCRPTVSPEGRHHRGHPKNSLITAGWTTVLSVCLLIKFQGRVPFLANSIVNMTFLQFRSSVALTKPALNSINGCFFEILISSEIKYQPTKARPQSWDLRCIIIHSFFPPGCPRSLDVISESANKGPDRERHVCSLVNEDCISGKKPACVGQLIPSHLVPLEDLPDCAMFMLPGSRKTGEQGNAGEV